MRTANRWKKITALAVSGLLLVTVGIGTWNALRPLPVSATQLVTVEGQTGDNILLKWPANGSAAAGVLGFGVVGANGEQTPRPTASIAKAITSLAVVEKSPIKPGEQGPLYTVTDYDIALYNHYYAIGGSVAKVSAGTQLSQYQALQAALLPSANNVADSLAIWVFGSLDAYKAYATDMVARLGMTDTTIGSDASGMSASTTSTPSDLVLLGQAIMQNSVLKDIVSQPSAVIPVAGTVYNVNWLLGQEGVRGIKTGNTDEAGGCFLGATTYALEDGTEVTIVTAILGAPTRNIAISDTLPLMGSVKTRIARVTAVQTGDVFGTYTTAWGAQAKLVAKSGVTLTHWRGYDIKISATTKPVTDPLLKGSKVGTALVQSGAQQFTVDLVLAQDIAKPSLWWRATRH